MSELNEQEGTQDEAATESKQQPAMELPGRRLREQRESSHLSREEVAHHLRLDAQLIQSLEDDDYSQLPSPAYICGYLRSYARLLKLPEDEIVQAYSHGEQINAALIPSSVSIQPKKTTNTGLIKTVVIIVIVVLVVGGLYLIGDKFDLFNTDHSQKSSQLTVPAAPKATDQQTVEIPPTSAPEASTAEVKPPVAQQSPPAPANVGTRKTVIENLPTPKTKIPGVESAETAPSVPAAPAPAQATTAGAANAVAQTGSVPVKTAQLRLHLNGDSWVEVTDKSGQRLVYRLVEKDQDLNLSGEPPFTILLGNAPDVQVFYDGKEFDHTRYLRGEIAYFKVGVK